VNGACPLRTKSLLIATAVIEAGAGVALLGVPAWFAEILLGEGLFGQAALVVARVAGFALMSLAVACWLVRNGERRAQAALVAGMLVYNFGVPIVLVHARFAWSLEGLALWPACVLHTGLGLWCLACLRSIH
jgi:hypothetical protein